MSDKYRNIPNDHIIKSVKRSGKVDPNPDLGVSISR